MDLKTSLTMLLIQKIITRLHHTSSARSMQHVLLVCPLPHDHVLEPRSHVCRGPARAQRCRVTSDCLLALKVISIRQRFSTDSVLEFVRENPRAITSTYFTIFYFFWNLLGDVAVQPGQRLVTDNACPIGAVSMCSINVQCTP
jgi:hypothetical protein